MFTQKVKHEHILKDRYLKTSVIPHGNRQVRYIHQQVCVVGSCSFKEAVDLIKELPEGATIYVADMVGA